MSTTADFHGLIFLLGDTLCAFPNSVVEEVSTVKTITPLPLKQGTVLGVHDLQGRTFSVWNLRAVLDDDLTVAPLTSPYLIVLTLSHKGFIGWVVNQVYGVRYISHTNCYRSSFLEVYLQYPVVTGLFTFADTYGIILDLENILFKIEDPIKG